MQRGLCKLCLHDGELQLSHLIPTSIFRNLRAREASNPNPLIFTSEQMVQSSEQPSAYVCCRGCEDIFNDGGERWTVPLLASLGGFPLYEMIEKTESFYRDDVFSAYHASSIPGFETSKIIHFGMSIFWKASVRNWGNKGPEIQIELGNYAEPIREFVLGRRSFPPRTYLSVCVLPPSVPLLGLLMPIRMKQQGFHRFRFYVPGALFELNVGKQVPEFVREECLATGSLQLVKVSPEFAKTLGKSYVDARRSARISPGYAKHLKLRGEG
jgi:hypothetical protein